MPPSRPLNFHALLPLQGPESANTPKPVCYCTKMSRALFACSGLDRAGTCIPSIFSAILPLCHSHFLLNSYSISLYLYHCQLVILVQLTRRRRSASKADRIYFPIDSYPLIHSSLSCLRIRTASSYYSASLHLSPSTGSKYCYWVDIFETLHLQLVHGPTQLPTLLFGQASKFIHLMRASRRHNCSSVAL